MVRTYVAIVVVMWLFGAACSSTADGDISEGATASTEAPVEASSSTTQGASEREVGTLSEWKGELAYLTVPLDHDDPTGPTIEVPVWWREASDPESRIGVLLVNPGGPGLPARQLLADGTAFTPELTAHFDIVALDPRGTFPATEISCFEDLGAYMSAVDWSPDAPGEVDAMDAAIQVAVDDCALRHAEVLPHVSTMDTVHDMALLVAALGEEQVSYLGISYGSVLGAAFVTTYPELVRAAVFSAALHPTPDPADALLMGAAANEALLTRIIEECDANPGCPIEGGAQAALQRVSAAADAEPFAPDPTLDAVNQNALFVSMAWSDVVYGGSVDSFLATVAAADAADPAPLQRRYADVAASQSIGALMAIRCLDHPYRGPADLPEGFAAGLEAVAPTYYAIFPNPEGFDPFAIPSECERWPAGPDLLPSPLSGEGAGPILVVSSTGDAIAPTESAELLATELINSTLLLVDDDRHVGYEAYPANAAGECRTEAIDRFLIELVAPPPGALCGA